jgi:hypothetical protein
VILAATLAVLVGTLATWLLLRAGPPPGAPDGVPGGATPVVTIAPQPVPASPEGAAPPTGPGGTPLRVPRESTRRPGPAERYVLESGPFASPEAADRVEDELNRRGHATVRFRKPDAPQLHTVSLTGFLSIEEARRAATQVGRGTPVQTATGPEVLLDRLPILGMAIAAARDLRAQGHKVRVSEAPSPALLYHVRYGSFPDSRPAEAVRDELARDGIKSRVVRVR